MAVTLTSSVQPRHHICAQDAQRCCVSMLALCLSVCVFVVDSLQTHAGCLISFIMTVTSEVLNVRLWPVTCFSAEVNDLNASICRLTASLKQTCYR